jgi:putative transposase
VCESWLAGPGPAMRWVYLLAGFGCQKSGAAAAGIRNRHDHGSQYMSDDYQAEIAFLGMESSPSFVRQPECNGCVERFIRTLKEQLLWVRVFQNVEELRCALAEFRERYNQRWIVQRLGYLTPAQARQQLLALGAAA